MSEEEIIKEINEKLIEPFYSFPNPTSIELKDSDVKLLEALLDLYQKEQQKNTELEEENNKFYNGELYTAKQLKNYEKTIKTYWVNKKIIKEKADVYENKGYIEIAGAMRELLEERK